MDLGATSSALLKTKVLIPTPSESATRNRIVRTVCASFAAIAVTSGDLECWVHYAAGRWSPHHVWLALIVRSLPWLVIGVLALRLTWICLKKYPDRFRRGLPVAFVLLIVLFRLPNKCPNRESHFLSGIDAKIRSGNSLQLIQLYAQQVLERSNDLTTNAIHTESASDQSTQILGITPFAVVRGDAGQIEPFVEIIYRQPYGSWSIYIGEPIEIPDAALIRRVHPKILVRWLK